jgi:hypothetical protein
MLRLVALALVLANAGFFAWSQGWLAGFGLAPAQNAEPHRLAQQIQPESMRILSTADVGQLDNTPLLASNPAAPAASAAATTKTECLQAGIFTEEQAGELRGRLQATLPPGSWTLTPVNEPGRWLVYMGRFANDEALAIKRGELSRMGVVFQPLSSSATLGAGLSLGAFSSQANADQELARLTAKGVRTARVVQDKPEVRGELLTLPVVDASLKAQLENVKPQLAGKALQSCR